MTPKLSILIPTYNVEPYIKRGLDSIPWAENIEVIARDDGSSDKTVEILQQYKADHLDYNFAVISVKSGSAASNYNALMQIAKGEYVQYLDSDDYFYTEKYKQIIARMNGEDCIYMDMVVNSGDTWHMTPDTRSSWCAPWTRAMRREFVRDIKFPEDRIADCDWFFNQELLKRNPVSVFTGIAAYHYNFPRKGSLMDLKTRGLIKERD